MSKRRKTSAPRLLFWTARDQQRFIENVERFGGMVNDMEKVLEPAKRKKAMAAVNGTAADMDTEAALKEIHRLLYVAASKSGGLKLPKFFNVFAKSLDAYLSAKGGAS